MSQSSTFAEQVQGLRSTVSSLTAALKLEEKSPAAQALKVQLANSMRMMQDNQKILNTSVAEDRAHRDQRHRFREHQLNKLINGGGGIKYPEPSEEMGDIRIDSPSTINHNYTPPEQPKSRIWPWVAGIAATGLLGTALGVGTSQLMKPDPAQPTNTTIEKTNGFLIDLMK